MKEYKSKTLADTVSTAGSMLLFLIFAICLLVIIAVSAGTYSRINAAYDRIYSTSASLRYITNKIKSSVSAEIFNDGSGLVLQNDGYKTVIYCADGGLYEKSISQSVEPTAEGGSFIFDINSFVVADSGNMYEITVVCGGESSSMLIGKG